MIKKTTMALTITPNSNLLTPNGRLLKNCGYGWVEFSVLPDNRAYASVQWYVDRRDKHTPTPIPPVEPTEENPEPEQPIQYQGNAPCGGTGAIDLGTIDPTSSSLFEDIHTAIVAKLQPENPSITFNIVELNNE